MGIKRICNYVRSRKCLLPVLIVITTILLVATYLRNKRTFGIVTPLTGQIRNDNQLTDVGNGTFYIFTIHAHQTKQGSKLDRLYVTGWERGISGQQKYICCLKYENGTHGKAFSAYKHTVQNTKPTYLRARLMACTGTSSEIESRPKWATLVLNSESCEKETKFIEVVYRQPEKVPSVAICGKVAYAQKDPRYLVEWVEYNKYLGVSKIVIYPYSDLHKPARKVLEYYVKEGIMETVEMPTVPLLDLYPRSFDKSRTIQERQDAIVYLFDAGQRLRQYQYYGVIDTDEFIVPKHPGVNNLLQLMEYLLRKYPNGGSFKMMSELHVLNWDKTNQTSDLMIEQYGHHNTPYAWVSKLLHVTSRIEEGTMWYHNIQTKPGFKVFASTGNVSCMDVVNGGQPHYIEGRLHTNNFTVDENLIVPSAEDDVVFKHFRKCPEVWLKQKRKECVNVQGQRDKVMEEVARVIGPRMRHVMSTLGI